MLLIFFFAKEQQLLEIEIYCNILNVFTVVVDQFNASLLNKVLNNLSPNIWTIVHIVFI